MVQGGDANRRDSVNRDNTVAATGREMYDDDSKSNRLDESEGKRDGLVVTIQKFWREEVYFDQTVEDVTYNIDGNRRRVDAIRCS